MTQSEPSSPDAEKLQENLAKLEVLRDRMMSAMAGHTPHHSGLDGPDHQLAARAAAAYFAELMSNPARLLERQMEFWTESLRNWSHAAQVSADAPDEPSGDRRFTSDNWTQQPIYSFLRRQYELTAHTMDTVTAGMTHLPTDERDRINFFTKQLVELAAPTNYLATNPDALQRAIATNGDSLVQGMENLVADLEANRKGHAVTLAQPDAFEVGKDIAMTPGDVVFENRMFQLIQYKATTDKVYRAPLLICPPWVNKFYILDLRPENSLVRWAVEQGHTVFMISWVNPDVRYVDCGMDTYLEEGLLLAIDKVRELCGVDAINTASYCIGGTLTSCALAYLTAKGEDHKIRSATFFTTLTDFSEPGELGAFMDDGFVRGLWDEIEKTGYLDGYFMARTFSYLRSRDLIYGPAVRSYLMGEAPPAFDLLQWNSDNTNLPGRMAIEYLQKLYLDNELSEGTFELLGEKMRLAEIKVPVFAVSTVLDHIAPWKSTFKGLAKTRGKRTFVLSESGHVAGIVNPPSKGKYGYWHNPEPPRDPDFWLQQADYTKASWWGLWNEWLTKGLKQSVVARSAIDPIEAAPGRYVLAKTRDTAAA